MQRGFIVIALLLIGAGSVCAPADARKAKGTPPPSQIVVMHSGDEWREDDALDLSTGQATWPNTLAISGGCSVGNQSLAVDRATGYIATSGDTVVPEGTKLRVTFDFFTSGQHYIATAAVDAYAGHQWREAGTLPLDIAHSAAYVIRHAECS